MTPELKEMAIRAKGRGWSYRDVAAIAGVSTETLRRTLKADPDFRVAMRSAKPKGSDVLLATIMGHAKRSWTAAAWILERTQNEMFGRRAAWHPDSRLPTGAAGPEGAAGSPAADPQAFARAVQEMLAFATERALGPPGTVDTLPGQQAAAAGSTPPKVED